MVKILTRYVLGTFAKILSFVFPVFIGLYLVVELVERMDDFLQYDTGLGTITLYLLLRIPIVGVQIGPLAILLSVALSVALLQRSREIMAFMAAGTSPWRVVHPFLLGALIISLVGLVAEELVLPRAHRALMTLQDNQRRAPPQVALMQQGELWFRASEERFVHIEFLDPSAERIHGLTIYRKDASGELIEQVHAREARWLLGRWMLLDGTTNHFEGKLTPHIDQFTRLEMPIGMEPEALRSMFTPPSHMSLSELQSYMRRLRNRGLDMTAYVRDFQGKLATPFMGVVMTVIGLAAMWGTPDNRRMSFGFVTTLCGAAAYWGMMMAGTALSGSQQVSLLIGIWSPHLIALGLSSVIFWRKSFV
jgi:lipopolysaccharide export system permease protein